MKYLVIAIIVIVGLGILGQANVIDFSVFDNLVGGLYNTAASIH